MRTLWNLKKQSDITDAELKRISDECEISLSFAKILANRGYTTKDEIDRYLFKDKSFVGYDGELMLDMSKAADVMCKALNDGKHIRIVSDYDVDGVTSNYILLKGLERCKEALKSASVIDYVIPHRIHDGYGINENIVRKAHEDKVELIITCDNGIVANDSAKLAHEFGIDYVVTDHHEPKEELPMALAVVDPHREGDPYPFKDICGAVVAYKLVEQMYKRANVDRNYLTELFVYAALGTVCDVMPLIDENRYIVKRGLIHLRNLMRTGKLEVGLCALIKALNLEVKDIDCYAFGFRIGPSINAAGRLTSAKWALRLLTEESKSKADRLAKRIVELNEIRKTMTEESVKEAMHESYKYPDDKVLVLYLKKCHESVAGIVAGRIREATCKPTLIVTGSKEAGVLKGSARSIESYDMFKSLHEFEELFVKFGGHPMAAGFSIKEENLEALRIGLNEKTDLTEEDFAARLDIDMVLELDLVDYRLISEIELMEPTGTSNERPIFKAEEVKLVGGRILGKNHNFIKMNLLSNDTYKAEGVRFMEPPESFFEELKASLGDDCYERFDRGERFDEPVNIVYKPKINEFMGTKTIQADMCAIRGANI